MKLNPKWEYVILERETEEKIGSIIVPDEYQKRNMDSIGVVQSVGDGAEDWVKGLVGETVVIKQHAGNWMKISGEEFFPIHQDDILAVMEQ